MTANFENYGRFYCTLGYANNDTIDFRNPFTPHTLKECMSFIENRMSYDMSIVLGVICDWDTGEVVASFERENEDFIDAEPDDIDDDCGFDPYEGCFTYDC